MSASHALQVAIKDRLEAVGITYNSAPVPFYDGPPSDRTYPSVTVGMSDFIPDDADCIVSREETIQIDVWAREQGRLNPCKIITDQVYVALHEVTLTASDPYAISFTHVQSAKVMIDPDGITAHGVIYLTAGIQTI